MSEITLASAREAPSGATDRVAPSLVAAALAIAAGLCLPALQGLAFLWHGNAFYGHAYAVPLTAAFLVWGSRAEVLPRLRNPQPPAWGAPLALAAGLLLVLSVMGDVGFIAGLGVPMLLGATLYAIGGMPLLRPLLLPLAFIALMVPPPHFIQEGLLVDLKFLVTDVSVAIAQAAGATVLAEGNRILLPQGELFVADACSGLTSIVTLLPIACIVAWFLSRGIWRRVLIVLCVFPLAIAGNIARVTGTVLLTSHIGLDGAQGSLHETFGLVTYLIGTLALIGVARGLRWL